MDPKAVEERLLKEYDVNVEFWKHHDAMRQTKMGNFLTTNSILAAALAFLISDVFSTTQIISLILSIGISIIGFATSVTWNAVMQRNSEYMRFQRLQLCSIERALPKGFTTFNRMYRAFDEHERVYFSCGKKSFKSSKRKSANKLEGALPKIMAVSWLVVAINCAAFLVYLMFS